ncbi:nitroreductase [Clostridium sp. CAG:411]|jgi:nitroreductase|nr:nitroreductase family protein [Lachnospiraceae bacterium]CDE47625.1 nitroreductase [Clostridium sp. CAG:411]
MKEIKNRRSIRKFKGDAVPRACIEEMVKAATLAPSAKNRQPWKFIVYQGTAKDTLVNVMKQGVEREKVDHERMPSWTGGLADAENTVRVMQEAPVLIAVLNTNGKTPFSGIANEDRIVEICDSLSIGAAIENMILSAMEQGLGTLWIANTCFAYDELTDYIDTEDQLTGIVAVGYANEQPDQRPRKRMEDVLEFR